MCEHHTNVGGGRGREKALPRPAEGRLLQVLGTQRQIGADMGGDKVATLDAGGAKGIVARAGQVVDGRMGEVHEMNVPNALKGAGGKAAEVIPVPAKVLPAVGEPADVRSDVASAAREVASSSEKVPEVEKRARLDGVLRKAKRDSGAHQGKDQRRERREWQDSIMLEIAAILEMGISKIDIERDRNTVYDLMWSEVEKLLGKAKALAVSPGFFRNRE